MNLSENFKCQDGNGNECVGCQFGDAMKDLEGKLKENRNQDRSQNDHELRLEACELIYGDVGDFILDGKIKVRYYLIIQYQ